MKQASFHCPRCKQMKLFQQTDMSHTPHILASVFLCGLWLPIWVLTAMSYKPSWHCSFCGFNDEPKYLTSPGLREREAKEIEGRRTAYRERMAVAGYSTNAFGEWWATLDQTDKMRRGIAVGIVGILLIIAIVGAIRR